MHDILDKGVNKITNIWWFTINVPYLFFIAIPDNIFLLEIWIIRILYVSIILNTTDEKCSYCCLAFVLRVQYKISIIFHVEYDSRGGISYCFLPFSCWGRNILGKLQIIPWLLLPWLLSSPGHQQPWYWIYVTNRSFSSTRKNFTTHTISGSRNENANLSLSLLK